MRNEIGEDNLGPLLMYDHDQTRPRVPSVCCLLSAVCCLPSTMSSMLHTHQNIKTSKERKRHVETNESQPQTMGTESPGTKKNGNERLSLRQHRCRDEHLRSSVPSRVHSHFTKHEAGSRKQEA